MYYIGYSELSSERMDMPCFGNVSEELRRSDRIAPF